MSKKVEEAAKEMLAKQQQALEDIKKILEDNNLELKVTQNIQVVVKE